MKSFSALLVATILGVPLALGPAQFLRARAYGQLTASRSNCRSIATIYDLDPT